MKEQIKTENQYNEALARVYNLMQKEVVKDSIEFKELDELVTSVKAYENEHYPMK